MVNKAGLKAYCHSLIQQRIDLLMKGMDDAQAAANEETKSSAGDKYQFNNRTMVIRELY